MQTKQRQYKKKKKRREKIKNKTSTSIPCKYKSKTKSEQIKYTIYKKNNVCQPRGVCCRNSRVVQYLKIKQNINILTV